MKKLAFGLLAIVSACAYAEPFQLKEFRLGDSAVECPRQTLEKLPHNGVMICSMGPTTLANQPAKKHTVYLVDGKIAGAQFFMESRGRYANQDIKAALIEKFGPPTSEKNHINEALWMRGNEILSFDGYAGTVGIIDHAAMDQAKRESAAKNKSDL